MKKLPLKHIVAARYQVLLSNRDFIPRIYTKAWTLKDTHLTLLGASYWAMADDLPLCPKHTALIWYPQETITPHK